MTTSTTPAYRYWRDLKHRLKHSESPKLHPKWQNFKHFVADVGEKPEGHSLRLINPRKDWKAGNVVWVPITTPRPAPKPKVATAKTVRPNRKMNPKTAEKLTKRKAVQAFLADLRAGKRAW